MSNPHVLFLPVPETSWWHDGDDREKRIKVVDRTFNGGIASSISVNHPVQARNKLRVSVPSRISEFPFGGLETAGGASGLFEQVEIEAHDLIKSML